MSSLVELKIDDTGAAEPERRWFSSTEMDLIVWYENEEIQRFELCYDKGVSEHVLIWNAEGGFEHLAVDDGEHVTALDYKESPIYVANGHIDIRHIHDQFAGSGGNLPNGLFAFIERKLMEHPANEYRA